VQGATAFLSGFLSALCLLESGTRPRADSLTRAVATVSSRGRHAVIADHCDLGAVAEIENAVGRSLASDCDDALESTFVRLFESGLATGLVAAGG